VKIRALGAAAVVVAGVGIAGAGPAAADATYKQAGFSQEVTFTYNGNEITCEFYGGSQVSYDTAPDMSFLTGQTGFGTASDPPACEEATLSLDVTVVYRNEDGDFESVSASAFDDYVTVNASERGAVTEVRGSHTVTYFCENDSICTTSVTTRPK
jgi:hypothetical protein